MGDISWWKSNDTLENDTRNELFFFSFLVFRWLNIISCSEIQVTDVKLTPNIMLSIAGRIKTIL